MDVQSAAEARRLAKAALQSGDNARVLQLLGPVVQAFPGDVEALMLGGIAFANTGDAARALSLFDRAAALQPEVAAIHYNRAMALERAGRIAEAIGAYQRTVQLQPNHAPAAQRLSALALQPTPPTGISAAPPLSHQPGGVATPAQQTPSNPPYPTYPPTPEASAGFPPPPTFAPGFPPPPPSATYPQVTTSHSPAPDPSMVINDSVASNPGRISLQWPVFLRCYPTTTLVYTALIIVSALLAVFVAPGWWVAVVLLALLLGKLAMNAKSIFYYGCACPGVVISHDPDLIAVCTDLDTGNGPDYWVIKILPHPLKRMSTGRPPVGTRIATVAGYGPGDEDGHWKDFMPVAAACATADRSALQRCLASFEPENWQTLETGLSQVPQRTPGLYPFKR